VVLRDTCSCLGPEKIYVWHHQNPSLHFEGASGAVVLTGTRLQSPR
jgi:hypothetical protein